MIEPALLLKRLVDNLLLPPAGPLLLTAVGLLLWRRRPWMGRVLAWFGVVLGLALCTQQGGFFLAGLVEPAADSALTPERLRAHLAEPDPPRALIVLAGGTYVDRRDKPHADAPSLASLRRAVHAARVSRWGDLPILVSGASTVPGRVPEAQTIARVIRDDIGVPVRWIEDKSLDTIENAARSAEMLKAAGITRVVLVTDAMHMRRSLQLLEATGLAVIQAPVGFSGADGDQRGLTWLPSMRGLSVSYSAAHELTGLALLEIRRLIGR